MCILDSMTKKTEAGERKKVVVVGGGVGGSLLAHSIQLSADVVLIDQKEYFEIPWSSLRSVVEPSFAERSVINHSDYLPNVQIVVSTATNITCNEVSTENGEVFKYDFLVVATGHRDSVPKTKSERLSYFKTEYEKVKSAKSVLIVGGGPTGVELAGEIAVDFPEKDLKLVHRGTRLLEFIGFKASKKVLDWMTSRKVEVILDQSIDLNIIADGVIQASAGKIIKADCHFLCTGKEMGSLWLHETILRDSLDIRGRLMVDENLRVRGYKNIFAIGDITDVPEIKQGYLAQRHAQVVAKNLKLLLGEGNEKKMSTYKPSAPIAVVSLGRREALVQFPLMTLCGYIPGILKSGDLFVGRTRKQLGLKPYAV